MKRIATLVPILLLFSAAPALADDALDKQLKDDVVLRALVDELQRSTSGLHMGDLKPPYFVEFGLSDVSAASVTAVLGAVTNADTGRHRGLRTDVRVGSYQLDNSNFEGGGYFGGGGAVPVEDDYNAIRQAVWWLADRDFKGVSEQLERKKAFMQSKMIDDKPEDFSREPPAVYFEPRATDALPQDAMKKTAIAVSDLFRKLPDVQSSYVNLSGGWTNVYLVNSEGTRIRTARQRFQIQISATVQADDGMRLSDSIQDNAATFDKLPTVEKLTTRCKEMVDRLLKIKAAPKLESYTGPVLFDARPAVQLFAGQFAERFCGGQRPVGGGAPPDDFEKKIGQRILPRTISVVDDPTLAVLNGKEVAAHYEYDDQGVRAQRVSLVEGGSLKTLLMSRNPSKKLKHSNGHGRGSYGPSASIGCLVVSSKRGLSDADLKKRLIDKCKDEDLEFGIRIAAFGGGGEGGNTPLAVYKVWPDGREEPIRGAEIAGIELNTFKHILAVGEKPHVSNSGDAADQRAVAAPAMLFEELTLGKIDYDFDKPPILPSPLARK